MSDWTPIHHEEYDEPEDAAPESVKPTDPPNKDKPTTDGGMPFAMTMGLMIPPDFIAAISSLAGTQERIALGIAEQNKLMAAMLEEIKAARDMGSPR